MAQKYFLIILIFIINTFLNAGGAESKPQLNSNAQAQARYACVNTKLSHTIALLRTPILLSIKRSQTVPDSINIHERSIFLLLVEQELQKKERQEEVKKIEDGEEKIQQDREVQRIVDLPPQARSYHAQRKQKKQKNCVADLRKQAFTVSYKKRSLSKSALRRLSNASEQTVMRAMTTFNESRETSSNSIPGQVN